jgi:hypothetical protein
MAANWHPLIWFEVLISHLFCGITFATFSGHPITDKDTFNISVCVLNRTGLFAKEIKMGILHGNNASKKNAFVPFNTFWDKAFQIAVFTFNPAS